MATYTIRQENELGAIAREILDTLPRKETATVIALQGDLGAGKTAFTKALARELGIQEHITSPTFVIMKSYAVSEHPECKTLTHIDAYRIEDQDEMRVLGFSEILRDPTRIVCIEWPERIQSLIPEDSLEVHIQIEKNGARTLSYGT